jgi:hypothetical protein
MEATMKDLFSITSATAATMLLAIWACSTQEEKITKPAPAPMPSAAPAAKAEAKTEAKAETKGEAKAKVEKVKGDVGLLDTEKNYLILVTKEGKLITVDFDAKSKATEIVPTPGKIADVGLGSTATVTYVKEKDKNIATGLEYKAAKGGD